LNRMPASPLRLNPELPAKLEEIINKALEKDRDVRCQTASELRADLKRLRRDTNSGRSKVAAPASGRVPAAEGASGSRATAARVEDSSTDRALVAHLARRHKKTLLGGLVAGAVAVAALVYWLAPPPPPPKVLGYVQITHDA